MSILYFNLPSWSLHLGSSHDTEDLLKLHHRHPVVLCQLISVALLEQVDRVSGDVAHDLASVIELTTVGDRAIVDDLDRDRAIFSACLVNRLLVQLN